MISLPILLKLETPAHRLAVILGHVHPARIAEEVRRMQHIDVQAWLSIHSPQ